MPSFIYLPALKKIVDQDLDLANDELKIMLVNDTYVPTKLDEFVDEDAADDAASGEIVATGYTGGYNGAGRKVATIGVTADDANTRVEVTLANLTWSALGGASNDQIVGAVLIKEGTNDEDSILIAYLELNPTTTNGNDFNLLFDASDGNLRITV